MFRPPPPSSSSGQPPAYLIPTDDLPLHLTAYPVPTHLEHPAPVPQISPSPAPPTYPAQTYSSLPPQNPFGHATLPADVLAQIATLCLFNQQQSVELQQLRQQKNHLQENAKKQEEHILYLSRLYNQQLEQAGNAATEMDRLRTINSKLQAQLTTAANDFAFLKQQHATLEATYPQLQKEVEERKVALENARHERDDARRERDLACSAAGSWQAYADHLAKALENRQQPPVNSSDAACSVGRTPVGFGYVSMWDQATSRATAHQQAALQPPLPPSGFSIRRSSAPPAAPPFTQTPYYYPAP